MPFAPSSDSLPPLYFTVDSALLRELGERLVGRAHIALAELVKNGYDADATKVVITIQPGRIVIADNGHGMTRSEFRRYWMRVGSPHKRERRTSPRLQRPLTGSKGVGRLATQFMAERTQVTSTSEASPERTLVADVDWADAVRAGNLTQAKADVSTQERGPLYPDGALHGTILELTNLKQTWGADALEELAKELWPLRPPFRDGNAATEFDIALVTEDPDALKRFTNQMDAILAIYQTRITGQLAPLSTNRDDQEGGPRTLQVQLQMGDGPIERHERRFPRCTLHHLDFEIRVFDLRNRQPFGISVGTAREYLNTFGGVHVYDAGFHLPYYGVSTDWLGIEMDHAHRLSRSKLLPSELQVTEGLNRLPTNSRLYGVVAVDTGTEQRLAGDRPRQASRDVLTVQVSRDRLVTNDAAEDMRDLVRYALDLYAVQETRRALATGEKVRDREPLPDKVQRVDEVLERHRRDMEPRVYTAIRTEVDQVLARVESEAERTAKQAGLLGALATAGISAVAFEHEFNRQVGALEGAANRLSRAAIRGDIAEVRDLADEVAETVRRARGTYRIFSPLTNEEDREDVTTLRARSVLKLVTEQLDAFLSGVDLDFRDVEPNLRLPAGRLAEWSALFQNLIVNATNAMLDSDERRVWAHSRRRGRNVALFLEDTGSGVALEGADALFEPFARQNTISVERRQLGFGGMGLGLTIVRMLASNLRCRVAFVSPTPGYSTALRLSWRPR